MSDEKTPRERAEAYLRPRADKSEVIQARGTKGIGWALLVLADTIAESVDKVLTAQAERPAPPPPPPPSRMRNPGYVRPRRRRRT